MASLNSSFSIKDWWQYLLNQADSLVMTTGSSFAESSLSSVFLPADGARMYNEAKACWLFAQLDRDDSMFHVTSVNEESLPYFEVNARSEPKDHLQIFSELVLGTYHYDMDGSTARISQAVLSNTLRNFQDLGDISALGISKNDPVVIVVNVDRRLDRAPPLTVYDDYDRVFELQFLVMTRNSHPEHVVAGLHHFNGWFLYDDLKTRFGSFSPWNADFKEDFIILLAGYVNTGQVPFGVPEEGRYGTRVFNPSRHDKDHQD